MTGGTPVLAPVSYEQFLADVAALAVAIDASGWRPERLVGIGRGGLAPTLWLSHATGIPMLSIDLSAQDRDFADAPIDRLAERASAGVRLLFVDDINDSGRTIASLRARLPHETVRFAVLIDNIGSSARADYRARTIDRAIDKSWFVFPWEAVAPRETIVGDAVTVADRLNPASDLPASPP